MKCGGNYYPPVGGYNGWEGSSPAIKNLCNRLDTNKIIFTGKVRFLGVRDASRETSEAWKKGVGKNRQVFFWVGQKTFVCQILFAGSRELREKRYLKTKRLSSLF